VYTVHGARSVTHGDLTRLAVGGSAASGWLLARMDPTPIIFAFF